MAARALAQAGPALGVDPAAFRFERVRQSVIGTHVTGREARGGVAVDGTWAGVHVLGGRVRLVQATASPLPGAPTAAPIGEAAAVAAATRALGAANAKASAAERLLVPTGSSLTDAYRVAVLSLAPAVAATVDIAAADGAVIAVRDDNRYEDAVATVFDPNPIVTAKDSTLRQPGVDEPVSTPTWTAPPSPLSSRTGPWPASTRPRPRPATWSDRGWTCRAPGPLRPSRAGSASPGATPASRR